MILADPNRKGKRKQMPIRKVTDEQLKTGCV